MRIGVLIRFRKEIDVLQEMQKVKDMGLQTCQLSCFDPSMYNDEWAEKVNAASKETGITVSTLWAGWSGPAEWDHIYGPATLGLVPVAYRAMRLKELMAAIPFAKRIGVDQIATHVGFLPDNPDHPDYIGTIGALRYLCREMKKENISFLFETGQETPLTILRAIEDIGTDNLGINFDTANLIIYGKGNPVDALRVFGKYVKDLHIKDGVFSDQGRVRGHEVPHGEGHVDFPVVIKMLKELGYSGPYTIEREISGEKQIQDIISARDMLLKIDQET